MVDEYSITRAFEIVRIFEKGLGSKLNLDKTEGMWFGSMAGRTDGPVNIKWRTDFIKVLVIFFTMSNSDFLSLNWNFRIQKLAKRLESWKFRTLSLKGKSMINNTFALSGLWYTGSVVRLPAWAEKRINQVHVPNFGGLSGSEDRGGGTTVSNSLILGGWVTKVLENEDKNRGVEGWVTTIF